VSVQNFPILADWIVKSIFGSSCSQKHFIFSLTKIKSENIAPGNCGPLLAAQMSPQTWTYDSIYLQLLYSWTTEPLLFTNLHL